MSTWAFRQTRARILKHNDTCWICGKPGADSVDHVIPRSQGGTDEPTNLRPAHMHPCNRAKSDRDVAPILRRSRTLNRPKGGTP